MLEALRHGTETAHARIEAAIDIEARLVSKATYRELVARLFGFHAAWEAACCNAPAWPLIAGTDLAPPTSRAALLGTDLTRLGLDEREIAKVPTCRPMLPVPDLASLLGALYVVEGSALGGVVIARMVERRLGISPAEGASFFKGEGAGTGGRWRTFASSLKAASSPAMEAPAIAAANRTFALMQSWLAPGTGDVPLGSEQALEAL